MEPETSGCGGVIVVHLGGQMTCTKSECDAIASVFDHHSTFASPCRICYPSPWTSARWDLESEYEVCEARSEVHYGLKAHPSQ